MDSNHRSPVTCELTGSARTTLPREARTAVNATFGSTIKRIVNFTGSLDSPLEESGFEPSVQPASARELRHLLARCGRPNVRGLIDEEAGFEPRSPTPTAVACLPISRFASSYPHRSPIRGLRSGFARLAGIFAALGFGKPSNSRTDPTSNILYVYIYGPLLMALLVHVVPPTQPSL